MTTLDIPRPNPRQEEVLRDRSHKYIAYGGARGGGKSWLVRTKAKLLALAYPGIRILILRRTLKELQNNHISILTAELRDAASYSRTEKVLRFPGGSVIAFGYCAADSDLMQYQGIEYDIIFIDEATNFTEYQLSVFNACLRGVNSFPKRIYYTCNPGGPGHSFIKRLFVDRQFRPGEAPEDYVFYPALPTDNRALMRAQPDYIRQLENLPKKLRDAWLYGRWDTFQGQYFEEFTPEPPADRCEAAGQSAAELKKRRLWCHVIEPMSAVPQGWPIMRSFDWGYARPFSCGYWTVDYDGRLYRITEFYGCTGEPNEGLKWDPDRVFSELRRFECSHPLLSGRQIVWGVADPSIWDSSRGVSIAETAAHHGIIFTPGDNKRVAGWQQLHRRLSFDGEGYPGLYVSSECRNFIRTLPELCYDPKRPEDLDTSGEDHIADETRYMCMSRPIAPEREQEWPDAPVFSLDPLG